MTFLNVWWLYLIVPAVAVLAIVRIWRRHYWGHSLVEQLGLEVGSAHPFWRLPRLLEALAILFLVLALLGPVWPFSINRVERGGLQILFVVDLSQSMEEPLLQTSSPMAATPVSTARMAREFDRAQLGGMLGTPGTRMEGFKKSALEFVVERPGDAIGLVVFSNNGYLVTPPSFDHESMIQYLLMTGTHTLVNEGYTGIGEGLATANLYFAQQRDSETSTRRTKGQVILLFTDGENNTGRPPMIEVESAKAAGTRIYMISIDVNSTSSATDELAFAIPSTGGKFYDVRRTSDLDQALADINEVEKGIFYTLSLTRNDPAFFWFALASFACLALRLMLHAFPHFEEIS
jgi:Ca-activated chloride channel family protein